MQDVDIGFQIPLSVQEILAACPKYTVASTRQQLFELATRDAVNGVHEVAYDVPGRGRVVGAGVGAGEDVPLAAVGWIEGLGRDAAAPPGRASPASWRPRRGLDPAPEDLHEYY